MRERVSPVVPSPDIELVIQDWKRLPSILRTLQPRRLAQLFKTPDGGTGLIFYREAEGPRAVSRNHDFTTLLQRQCEPNWSPDICTDAIQVRSSCQIRNSGCSDDALDLLSHSLPRSPMRFFMNTRLLCHETLPPP